MFNDQINRRNFVKKAAYTVPLIVTLKAVPAFAASGSNNGPLPGGNPPTNKGPGKNPGKPGKPGKPGRN